MSRTTNETAFDCLAFKRAAQADIYEAIRNMSGPEQIEYFRRRAESGVLGDWWRAVKRTGGVPNVPNGASDGSDDERRHISPVHG